MFFFNNPDFATTLSPISYFVYARIYVGHLISSDNGFISEKLFLKSEFYYPLPVAMGGAYSCLKYNV